MFIRVAGRRISMGSSVLFYAVAVKSLWVVFDDCYRRIREIVSIVCVISSLYIAHLTKGDLGRSCKVLT